jgi:polyisoprenoid-binding protein YceI
MIRLLCLALALGVLSCKSSAPQAKAAPGDLVLDAAHSKLSAVAMKNESKAVELRFPELKGSLSLSPLSARVEASIEKLETGDKLRDQNVKTFFFDTAFAANKTAEFNLTKLDGDLAGLKEGQGFPMRGQGTLALHGARLALSGPLTITRLAGGGYSASFKDLWVVNIKDAGMLEQLANLNKNCPQPHRVGLNVALQGELVFAKQ